MVIVFVLNEKPIYDIELVYSGKTIASSVVLPDAKLAFSEFDLIEGISEYSIRLNDITMKRRVEATVIVLGDYNLGDDTNFSWLDIAHVSNELDSIAYFKFCYLKHEKNIFASMIADGSFDIKPKSTDPIDILHHNLKMLIIKLRPNGELRDANYYFSFFDEVMSFIGRLSEKLLRKLNPIVFKHFMVNCLSVLRSFGLFGPHAVLCYYCRKAFEIQCRLYPYLENLPNENLEDNMDIITSYTETLGYVFLMICYQPCIHERFMSLVRSYYTDPRLNIRTNSFPFFAQRAAISPNLSDALIDKTCIFFKNISNDDLTSKDISNNLQLDILPAKWQIFGLFPYIKEKQEKAITITLPIVNRFYPWENYLQVEPKDGSEEEGNQATKAVEPTEKQGKYLFREKIRSESEEMKAMMTKFRHVNHEYIDKAKYYQDKIKTN